MRAVVLAFGSLIVAAIVLLWPPAAFLDISKNPHGATMAMSISDLRAAILVFAVATFIAAVVSAVISVEPGGGGGK